MTLKIINCASILLCTSISIAQSGHDAQDGTHHGHENIPITNSHQHRSALHDEIPKQAKLLTGQGEFDFSWDQKLTAAFPEEAI